MLYPTTPSTLLTSAKQKSSSDHSPIHHWHKPVSSRFPLKFYKFTPRKQESPPAQRPPEPATLPAVSPPLSPTPLTEPLQPASPVKTEEKPNPVEPAEPETVVVTPRRRARCPAGTCGSTRAKEGSECSEYSPGDAQLRRRRRPIRKTAPLRKSVRQAKGREAAGLGLPV